MENKGNKISLLEELRMRKQRIADAGKYIDDETSEYKLRIKKYEDLIESEKLKLRSIQNTQLPISLETFVEEIAKKWEVNVDDLVVNIEFPKTSAGGKYKKYEFVKLQDYQCFINGGVDIKITITTKNKSIAIKRKLKLSEIQRDGQELRDFLDVETKKYGSFYFTNFICPDYKNLVLQYELRELLNDYYAPKNKISEMILETYQIECENKVDQKI